MRTTPLWILFVLAACGKDADSSSPGTSPPPAIGAPAKNTAGPARYTHRDPAFTVELGDHFGPRLDQDHGVKFEERGYGGLLTVTWADFRFGQDPAEELRRQAALWRDDPAPKGPILGEGELAGGGVWIERKNQYTPSHRHVIAVRTVGKRVVTCSAHGEPEVAGACKTLR